MSKKPYSHASHIHRVLKASKARCAARCILGELCRAAYFDRPETCVSKDQLINMTGYTRRTVQLALQFLREEGSIVPTVPLADFVPGRGKAVTYRLCVVGQGAGDNQTQQNGEGLIEIANRLQQEDRTRGENGRQFSHYLSEAKKQL